MAIYRNYQDESSRRFWMEFDRDMGRNVDPKDYGPDVKRTIGKPAELVATRSQNAHKSLPDKAPAS